MDGYRAGKGFRCARMPKEELREKLGSPDIVIIDVRAQTELAADETEDQRCAQGESASAGEVD